MVLHPTTLALFAIGWAFPNLMGVSAICAFFFFICLLVNPINFFSLSYLGVLALLNIVV